jgi:hypothetical protein
MMPLLSVGIVTAHDPNGGGIVVNLRTSGQLLGFPIRMSYRNSADGLRIKQDPLPGLGSWALVAFPYGDHRNGIFLGSYLPSQVDAITTKGDKFDPFLDYESTFSGHWSLLDGQGNQAIEYADGSYFTAASGLGLPTIYRHIVDQNQTQQRVAFTRADRIPNPPSPFYFQYQHASGTSFTVNPSGSVTVSGVAGASGLFEFGGTTVSIDASGNTTTNGASGAAFAANFNGASIKISSSGVITLNTDSIVQIELNGAPAADALALVSKLVSKFNAHTHPDPQGGTTGTPTSPWSASDIQSSVALITS